LQEIPEWKAEIEQQKKNIKKYPEAERAERYYVANGRTDVSDKPMSKEEAQSMGAEIKFIAHLKRETEVLVLSKEGEWYEILYADIRGWVYSDDLKPVK
jgi:hypothetical protein